MTANEFHQALADSFDAIVNCGHQADNADAELFGIIARNGRYLRVSR